MIKSEGTPIGINVNKSQADKKINIRDTVFKKGSSLNTDINFYTKNSNIGYVYGKVNQKPTAINENKKTVEKDSLKIKGSLDSVLKASVPKKKEDKKDEK